MRLLSLKRRQGRRTGSGPGLPDPRASTFVPFDEHDVRQGERLDSWISWIAMSGVLVLTSCCQDESTGVARMRAGLLGGRDGDGWKRYMLSPGP